MNVFHTHSRIVEDYKTYIRSFLNIADPNIRKIVEEELEKGKLWPEPLLQFNPSFEIAGSVASLSAAGFLHSDIADIFKGFSLYRHQVEAIRLGTTGKDFIVTSGTGSGKSLTYIGSIFHYLLSNGSTWRLYSFAGINPRRFQSTSMTFFINSPGQGQQRLIAP